MNRQQMAALAYLLWDGWYGPLTPQEYGEIAGWEEPFIKTRQEAITTVNEAPLTPEQERALRQIYGRYPI
mgnify:CR=1 FL=1